MLGHAVGILSTQGLSTPFAETLAGEDGSRQTSWHAAAQLPFSLRETTELKVV